MGPPVRAAHNYGTVWKVSRNGKETILHNFAKSSSNGCFPYGGVARDSKGNLYGVSQWCGARYHGVLYELSAKGAFTLLHSLSDSEGWGPLGESLRGDKGTLFGTTVGGGTYGYGTVWKYVP